jgi:acyl-CoA synthetase (NDP forming)/GNAT superfamily N-acetyltransferase
MVASGVDVVRADGGLAHIRPVQDGDRQALLALNARVSDRSIYHRFFISSRHLADLYVNRLLRPMNTERDSDCDAKHQASAKHQALVALVGGRLVGVAAFEPLGTAGPLDTTSAEIALLVDDHDQHEGIGTLLVEQLAGVARRCGVRRFVAEVLAENTAAIRMIGDLGFEITPRLEGDIVRLSFELEPTPQLVAAVEDRERAADNASIRPLLAPRSVAVIGAGTRPRSIGHEVLRNILEGGFAGSVHVVNPRHDVVLGVRSVPSPRDLPVAPDLAIVVVPAADVPQVVRACGERGARGILLVSAGFGEIGDAGMTLQHEVLATARGHGMRLIGPNCLGLVNTDPAVSLNATFAPLSMRPGNLGLISQSGAIGFAVLTEAQRCGLAISQFVSVGNMADVSGSDLLLSWGSDERTSVIALYLESFGNPRKFARIASGVSRTKPIIALKAGRSPAGQRAGRAHTASAASADPVVDALFAQSGVLRVDRVEQMLDVARLLCEQPLPAGPRVAIVGNSGGAGILAVDAAVAAGLEVVELDEATSRLVRQAVPSAASCRNPVDLGATARPDETGEAVRILLGADEVDAVLTVFAETLVAGPDAVMTAIVTAAAESGKPIAATQIGGHAHSVPQPGTSRALPVFAFPEPAATAMGFAYRYARFRSAPPGEGVRIHPVDAASARAVILDRLAGEAGWLGPEEAARLLIGYGISTCPQRVVADVEAQPAAAGIELVARAVHDAQFGPVLTLGAGGVLADTSDRQVRLAPLTIQDADEMISGLRPALLLDGVRGLPPACRQAVRMLLLRLAALVGDLPEVAESELNLIVCRGGELTVADARVRVAPARPDPVLRQLQG